MTRLLAVMPLTAAYLSGQAVPVCSAVSQDQATAILGPSAKRTKDPSGCEWRAANDRQMNVVRVGSTAMFEMARASEAKKGKARAEDGLGGTAFSAIRSANGGGAAIYLLKGQAILIVDVQGFTGGAAEERLPRMRELVRILALKL